MVLIRQAPVGPGALRTDGIKRLKPLLRALGITFRDALGLGGDDEVQRQRARDETDARHGKPEAPTTQMVGKLSASRLRILRRAVSRRMVNKRAEEWERIFDEEGVWYTRVMRFEKPGDVLALGDGDIRETEHGGRGLMSRVRAQCVLAELPLLPLFLLSVPPGQNTPQSGNCKVLQRGSYGFC